MKVKRLLGMALLSASLVLSSCDALNNLMPGNRSSKNSEESSDSQENQQSSFDYGSNINPDDYQGKAGATELSKADWDKAFSLEETALRRNVKINALQPGGYTVINEIDHGKFKVTVTDGQEQESGYYRFTNVSNNMVDYEAYYQTSEKWGIYKGSDQLDYAMSQLGILTYDQADFTYDATTRTYKSASFTYAISYEETDLTLYITDAVIAINDGLPAKVEFDFVNPLSDTTEPGHYSATYYDYGKVTVTLPEVEGSDLPDVKGEEITFAEFKAAHAARPEADFNHVVIDITGDGQLVEDQRIEATYVYGMWESDSDTIGSTNIESLIITEEMLAQLEAQIASYDFSFYYDEETETYAYCYSVDFMGITMSANAYYNKYFYCIKQESDMFGSTSLVEASWSKVDIPNDYQMKVAGRAFVGVDIQETNFVYYDSVKEVIEATTLEFGTNGVCYMRSTKASSGTQVANMITEMYGYYEQTPTKVGVSFSVSGDGQTYQRIPEDYVSDITLTISQDTVIMETMCPDASGQPVTIHAILRYTEEASESITFPEIEGEGPIDEDDGLSGTYAFSHFDYVLFEEGGNEAAAQEALRTVDGSEFASYILSIDEDYSMLAIMISNNIDVGLYEIYDDVLVANISMRMETGSQEPVAIDGYQFELTINEDGTLAANILSSQEDGYVIRAVYAKMAV